MAADNYNDEKTSPLGSNLKSAIGALKGRHSNDNPTIDLVKKDPAPKPVPLTVMADPIEDTKLYPVSSDLPEGRTRQQLLELTSQNKSLTQALEISNATIDTFEKQLVEAQATIARLALERTDGIESIIGDLRKLQAEGANLKTAGLSHTTLSSIFSTNARLTERANKAAFNMKLENDIRLALETLQIASGNGFSFTIETAERPDFYNLPNVSGKNNDLPAKLMIIDLEKTGNTTNNGKMKVVTISLDDKIFYLKDSDFIAPFDRKAAFLNSSGSRWNVGIFKSNKQKIEYDYNDISSPYPTMKGPYSSVPVFIDEIIGSCLPEVVSSNGFDQAASSLKTMGLIP